MRREVLWVLELLPMSFLETMARLSLEVPWSTGTSKSLCLVFLKKYMFAVEEEITDTLFFFIK